MSVYNTSGILSINQICPFAGSTQIGRTCSFCYLLAHGGDEPLSSLKFHLLACYIIITKTHISQLLRDSSGA